MRYRHVARDSHGVGEEFLGWMRRQEITIERRERARISSSALRANRITECFGERVAEQISQLGWNRRFYRKDEKHTQLQKCGQLWWSRGKTEFGESGSGPMNVFADTEIKNKTERRIHRIMTEGWGEMRPAHFRRGSPGCVLIRPYGLIWR